MFFLRGDNNMEKAIKIGEKDVRISNNVAWTMEYRNQFNKDIVPALMPLIVSVTEGISAVLSEAGSDVTLESISEAVHGRVMDIMLPLFQAEFVDLVVNVTWAMAKAADESIAPPKQWVRQFDEFPLDVIGPEIFEMVMKGFVSSKNLERLKSLKSDLKSLQPKSR